MNTKKLNIVLALFTLILLETACANKINISDGVDKDEAASLASQYLRKNKNYQYSNILKEPVNMGEYWEFEVYNARIHKAMAYSISINKMTGEASRIKNKNFYKQ